ncbi:unnamed protein product [Cuscuta campestris]|uniref:Uncharacterized protein n=1 Tax=Cuscuta campestris TaxID=132261 RepID=A0A484N2V3_9ASTE|nr:unnamed protein product [Cuscuta campestris]
MNLRESKRPICPYANTSKDLLVCLPSRSHLTLMPKGPKPICSPATLLQASKRNHHHHHHRKKLLALRSGGSEQASEIAEPTSPKVTCAGQIKVRPGRPASSGKNWQAVMEEIEKLHERRHTYKGSSPPSSPLWFKKDVMQFFACLRGIRFDFRCFGAFPSSATSDDDDDDEDDEEEDTGTQNTDDGGEAKPEERAMFSKWFMVLEEPQQNPVASSAEEERGEASGEDPGVVPPRNALLLMRCRSAPPKSWLEEKVGDDVDDDHEEGVADESSSKTMAEMYEGENLVEMRYGKKLCTISTDIVKETWVVEGITKDPLSRSRSWKR